MKKQERSIVKRFAILTDCGVDADLKRSVEWLIFRVEKSDKAFHKHFF